MRYILFLTLGFLVSVPANFCFCDQQKISGAVEQPTLLSPESEQIVKEEWEKANEPKQVPQYSPSSVSVDEAVLQQKPLMTSDHALKADENNNAIESKLSSVVDLPKEFDQLISFRGKMKLFEAIKNVASALERNLVFGPGVQDSDVDVSLDNVQAWRALSSLLILLGMVLKLILRVI